MGERRLKQEQEDASAEIVEVAPGILRLQLPIDFTGLGHVNTYALEDGDGFALVDPGLPGEKSWAELQARMGSAGIPLRRVHTVVITHSHPDHFGGAGLLAEESGATIVASDRFRTFWDPDDLDDSELQAADDIDAEENPLPRFMQPRPSPWGGAPMGPPPERRAQMMANLAESREWVGLFTPGHTDDHLCLYDEEAGILLVGDQVLPTITPHISGLIPDDPLLQYVESLDRLAALPHVTRALPAHGQPFGDLPGRVEQIKVHHDQRLDQLLDICRETGWASVVDLSHRLFAPRSWGSMAEAETYAHLERLRIMGQAEVRHDPGGVLSYRVTDPDDAADPTDPDGSTTPASSS